MTIDKRSYKVRKIYRKLSRKQKRKLRRWRRKNRRYRRRRRRRKAIPKPVVLSSDERSLMKQAIYHRDRYEKMIRRFACRYIKRYPKRHKSHCKR